MEMEIIDVIYTVYIICVYTFLLPEKYTFLAFRWNYFFVINSNIFYKLMLKGATRIFCNK